MISSRPVYINIPCPSKDEALNLCRQLIEQDLCGTAKIHEHTTLLYPLNGVQSEDIVLMTLKTTDEKIPDIHGFILKHHSWGTPCIEVIPLLSDMC